MGQSTSNFLGRAHWLRFIYPLVFLGVVVGVSIHPITTQFTTQYVYSLSYAFIVMALTYETCIDINKSQHYYYFSTIPRACKYTPAS